MAGYSNYLQTVVTVFMLLFSINFGCYYLLLLRRVREAFNAEVRVFLLIVAAAVAVITVDLRLNGVINSVTGESFTLYGAIHHAAFTVSSRSPRPATQRQISTCGKRSPKPFWSA